MAFTKVVGAGIHTLSNLHTHNINSSGIITATNFVGIFSGTNGDFSGNVTVDGNLVVNGDTTTLNTTLREVELLRVDASDSVAAGIITQTGSGDILKLYDSTAEVFTVADGGNVTVQSTYPVFNIRGTHASATSTGTLNFNLRDGNSANRTVAKVIGRSDGNGGYGSLDFHTAFNNTNIKRMSIDKNGKVGIGTDLPDYPLDVIGSIGFSGQTRGLTQSASSPTYSFDGDSDTGMYRGNGVNILSFATAGNERLKIDAGGAVSVLETGDNKGLRIHTNSGVSATNNELRFNTGQTSGFTFMANSDGTSSNERLRITGIGSVGIGTNNPTKKLHINTTGSGGDGILLQQTGDTYPAFIGDADRSAYDKFLVAFQGFWNGNRVGEVVVESGSDTTNKDEGIVKIRTRNAGESSPQNRLTVYHTGQVEVNSGTDTSSITSGALRVNGGVGIAKKVIVGGNVGVGIATATAKLEISDAIGETGEEVLLKLQGRATKNVYLDINADANRRGIIRFKSGGTDKWSIGRGDSDDISDSSFFITSGNSGGSNAKFAITSDGKVGIGITNPFQKLSVFGNIYQRTSDFITWNNGDCQIGGVSGYHFAISTYDGSSQMLERVRVTGGSNGGLVGIGTDDPTAELEVVPSGTNTTSTIFIHAPTHNTNVASEAILKFGYGHSGNPDGVGHIKMVEQGNNSFDADFKFSLPTNNGSGGSSVAERLRLTSVGQLCLTGTSNGVNTQPPLNGFNAYYETDQGQVTLGSYSGGGATHIAFYTNEGGNPMTQKMCLQYDGRLGLGIDTPVAGDLKTGDAQNHPKFHIKGTAGAGTTFSDNSTTGGEYNLLARFEAGGDADNTGSMIVLNHSNDRGLALVGGRSVSNRSYGAIKSIDNVGRLSNVMAFHGDSGRGVEFIALYTGDSENTTSRLYINSEGKVGIGTDNPRTGYLHVGPVSPEPGSAFNAPLSVYATGDLGGNVGSDNKIATFAGRASGNVSGLSLYHFRERNGTNYTTDGFSFRQEVDNTENVYEYMNFTRGKIGIGTMSPSKQVHIEGTIPFLRLEDATVSSKRLDLFVENSDGYVGANQSAQKLHFQTTTETRMTIDAVGKVIIGMGGQTSNQGRVTIKRTADFSTASISDTTDNIYLISDSTSGDGVYGASIGFSRVGYADRRAAAIASVQEGTDEDLVGLAFFTHDNADATAAIVEKLRITPAGSVECKRNFSVQGNASGASSGRFYTSVSYVNIPAGSSATLTFTGLYSGWADINIGGYSAAGQSHVHHKVAMGGYMTQTYTYDVTVLATGNRNVTISGTKNASSYVIVLTNNAADYGMATQIGMQASTEDFAVAIS